MSETRKLRVRCPDCQSRLVVDAATGEVLAHETPDRPAAAGQDFEELLADLDRGKAEAEAVFAREVAAHEDQDRLLEEKFREAMKRAADEPEDERPPSPFDYD